MTVELIGFDEIEKVLEEIAPRESTNLMRATIHGIASEAAKEVKRAAPKDRGDLKRSIKAKRKKSHPDRPAAEVIFANPDTFYWRFVEHGTADGQPARPFVGPVAERYRRDLPNIMRKKFFEKLEKRMIRAAKSKGNK